MKVNEYDFGYLNCSHMAPTWVLKRNRIPFFPKALDPWFSETLHCFYMICDLPRVQESRENGRKTYLKTCAKQVSEFINKIQKTWLLGLLFWGRHPAEIHFFETWKLPGSILVPKSCWSRFGTRMTSKSKPNDTTITTNGNQNQDMETNGHPNP